MINGVASDAVNFGGVLGPAPRTLSFFSNHIIRSLDEHRLDIGGRYFRWCSDLREDDVIATSSILAFCLTEKQKKITVLDAVEGSLCLGGAFWMN